MDYPATQMFVNDDDVDEEEEEDDLTSMSLGRERDVKVGILVIDSVDYPVRKGINKVGRIESCSIVIDHNTISKEHAEIEASSKSVFVSDLGSLNKTKLNDAVLRPGRMYQLQDGDVLRFGLVQAIFKSEENKEEKTLKDLSESNLSLNKFVIPETPVSVAKETHKIIPSTPDLSFEDTVANRSSSEENISSDISLIAGTQQGRNRSNTSGLMVCNQDLDKGEISIRSESTPKIDRKHPASDDFVKDISDLETQKDLPAVDSDEENIFEMMTQQSNVHQEETQNSVADALPESRLPSISDLETQKFDIDGRPESHSRSINDLETQKFGINDTPESRLRSISDLKTQKFGTDLEAASHSRSINQLGTRNVFVEDVDREVSRSAIGEVTEHFISDVRKQKLPTTVIEASDDEDSETDEEGLFADSGDGSNIFDAPTQLILSPDKEGRVRRAALEISSDSRERGVTKAEPHPEPAREETPRVDEEETSKSVEARVNNEEEKEVGPIELETSDRRSTAAGSSPKKSETPERKKRKRAALNDSVESKLNNMFDDVNDSVAEEPTQMLTQHLERILESTQVDRPIESDRESEEPLKDGDAKTELDEMPQPEEASTAVFRVPEILSTQELFADLPFVNIRGTATKNPPSTAAEICDVAIVSSSQKSAKRESDRLEATMDDSEQQKPKKNHTKKTRVTRRAGKFDIVSSEAPKSTKKNTVPKKVNEKSAEMKMEEIVAVIHAPTRRTDRRKLRGAEGISTQSSSLADEGMTSPEKTAGVGKRLPPKKRGFMISESEELPAEIKHQIETVIEGSPRGVKRPRIKKREVAAESDETPTRLSVVVHPEEVVATSETTTPMAKATRGARLRPPSSMLRVDYTKSDSPKPSASVPMRKGNTRSRGSEQEASVVDDPGTLGKKNEPKKPVAALNARGASRRLRKKTLEKATVVSDEELAVAPTPAKRLKQSNAVQSDSAIADLPARPETPILITRGRGKGKNAINTSAKSVESTASKSAQSIGDGLSIRSRRARGVVNKVRDSPPPSSFARFDDATQSSLESQEIQAILSKVDVEASPTSRSSFRSSSKAEKRMESNDKPAAKPPTTAKKRGAKVTGNQTTIEEFLKPKAEPLDAQDSPRTRGRPSIRGRRVAPSRTVALPGEKENAVEEVGRPKRGKKSAAESVASSEDESVKVSPLRRGRSLIADRSPSVMPSSKTKHKILFTGLNDPQLTSAVSNLGGTVTEKPSECTALVTDKVRRTYKFLCAMAMAVPIVPVDWLKESERRGRFLETSDFLLQDPIEEAKFNFNLCRSLEMAKDDRLLEGYTVVLTPNTAPPPTAEMKGIIQACGGKALVRPPTSWPNKSLVISRQEDVKNAKKFLAKAPSSVPLVTVEFILTGILRHELNFEEHKLKI